MQDYSNYYFKDLLEAIDDGCQKIGEKRDFVNYLLSMENAESIEKLVEIYDNIYKLLFVFIYGLEKFPIHWYKPENGGYYKPNQIVLLNRYFNDNILRLFKQLSFPTKEQFIPYIANLRVCVNSTIIQQKILEKQVIDEDKLLRKLGNTRELHYNIRKDIEKTIKSDPQYPSLLQKYRSLSIMLDKYGRIFDVSEIAFAKENNIDYDTLLEQEKEYLENKKKEEEARLLEKEIQLREVKKKKKKEVIASAILAAPIFFLIIYFFDYIRGFVDFLLVPAIFFLLGLLLLAL